MVKGESILMRIAPEDKAAIKDAADRLGKSVTTFMVEAALKESKRVAKRREPVRGVHGGVPSFFRAQCWEAAHGGANGYDIAGYTLARHIGHECPDDLTLDEWIEEVNKLTRLLIDGETDAAFKWFKAHFPKMMKLVPTRRRDQFIAGVERARDDDKLRV